jgi:phosphoglycerate dehydrogenase-like enzyme
VDLSTYWAAHRCPRVEFYLVRKKKMTDVTVVIGAGAIGQAIARRVSAGKHVLLADLKQETASSAAKVLSDAGFAVTTAVVDGSGAG